MSFTITLPYEVIEIFSKLILPIIVGYIIGRERKKNDKSGGSRTMALVCLSGAIIAFLTTIMNVEGAGYSRLMASGIQGIGFLCAGLIMQYKRHIEGLTTSATIFCLVPIGYLFGMGYISYGLILGVFIFLILESKYLVIKSRRR